MSPSHRAARQASPHRCDGQPRARLESDRRSTTSQSGRWIGSGGGARGRRTRLQGGGGIASVVAYPRGTDPRVARVARAAARRDGGHGLRTCALSGLRARAPRSTSSHRPTRHAASRCSPRSWSSPAGVGIEETTLSKRRYRPPCSRACASATKPGPPADGPLDVASSTCRASAHRPSCVTCAS